jgi:hypothetical protein
LFLYRWGNKVVGVLGCDAFDNEEERIMCLQQVPVEVFAVSNIQNGPNSAQAVIDGEFAPNPFLPYTPKQILDSGDYNFNVSILLGCNRYILFDGHNE